MSEERLSFQAEVSRLLDIVAHALYSDREVFLRELVSNSADACDKLRHARLVEPDLAVAGPAEAAIRITFDEGRRTLTVSDTGIGMNRQELIENLGTIARSGTAEFMARLKDAQDRPALIGQFGVGFYAAFMVAERVEVLTRRAGEGEAWRWESTGKGDFVVGAASKDTTGTEITLHLKHDQTEFLSEYRLRTIVQKYSDHISVPIFVGAAAKEPANRASALWTRSKAEIDEKDYAEFFRHVGQAYGDPWLTLHWRAEGMIDFTALLFVPESRPFDLMDPSRRHRVRLYVKRVFITDDAEGLVPPWLRFLRGVVDSDDLPLNISREMLQKNPVVTRIRGQIVRKVLSELARRATEDAAGFAGFWEAFGLVLKEGLYDDQEHRDELLKVARFRSTAADGLVGLADYVGRLRPGQEAIYYITGDDPQTVARSPQLEGFRAKGVEVLLLTDPIDEFWTGQVGSYEGRPLKSVTRGGADLAKIEAREPPPEREPPAEVAPLISLMKATLGEAVSDVRVSERLTDSPVCLVAEEGDVDIHLERLLKAHGQGAPTRGRVLEINPSHPLIRQLSAEAGRGEVVGEGESPLADVAWLLLDQARILEGDRVSDPAAFSRRFSAALARGLTA